MRFCCYMHVQLTTLLCKHVIVVNHAVHVNQPAQCKSLLLVSTYMKCLSKIGTWNNKLQVNKTKLMYSINQSSQSKKPSKLYCIVLK